MSRRRGQLVVLAALAIAVALVPMALAYLQLGYDDDVNGATVDDDTVRDVERTLGRALVDVSTDVPARYTWADRSEAVTTVRDRLEPTIRSVTVDSADSATAITVSFNDTRARERARTACPDGPDRDFGPCRADRGVVVQEREGDTHVLAVAVDVRVTTPNGETHAVSVVSMPVRR